MEQAAKNSGYDFSGYSAPKNQWSLYTLSYEQFVVPLVKAMQEQQLIIDQLTKQVDQNKVMSKDWMQQVIIADQQKQINLLEKRLAVLEAKLQY